MTPARVQCACCHAEKTLCTLIGSVSEVTRVMCVEPCSLWRCSGEHWDQSEQMDTYYNPIPHFTYQMALDHSPTLQNVPVLPRGDLDDFEGGGASSL